MSDNNCNGLNIGASDDSLCLPSKLGVGAMVGRVQRQGGVKGQGGSLNFRHAEKVSTVEVLTP